MKTATLVRNLNNYQRLYKLSETYTTDQWTEDPETDYVVVSDAPPGNLLGARETLVFEADEEGLINFRGIGGSWGVVASDDQLLSELGYTIAEAANAADGA